MVAPPPWHVLRAAIVPLCAAFLARAPMRPVSCLTSLSNANDYGCLRHGQSLANVDHLIVSNPAVAVHAYGLSQVGHDQARRAADSVVAQNRSGVVLVASDFLRAKETAEVVERACQDAGVPVQLAFDERLRERQFGDWDMTSDDNYQRVWDDDAMDPWHTNNNVESVMSTRNRTLECIQEWDAKVTNKTIVCVAHGDVLQILQTAFEQVNASDHRSLPPLETATYRRLEWKGE